MTYQELFAADLIVIDEMSMLTQRVLSLAKKRLHDVCGPDFLTKKPVLLVGDHCQLPAVCHHKQPASDAIPNICARCHISASSYYPQIIWHHLRHSVRQAEDPEFLDFLNIIRFQQPTQEQIDAALGQCVVDDPIQFCTSSEADVTVLCTHNKDVDTYNGHLLRARYGPGELVDCSVVMDCPEELPGTEQVNKQIQDLDNDRLHEAAIGASVVLKANLNVKLGAVNNATATILAIDHDHNRPNKLTLKLDHNGKTIRIGRTWTEHLYAQQATVTFRAFPCMLGYAMTGHASQGAAIAKTALLVVRKAFSPGLLYVMLS